MSIRREVSVIVGFTIPEGKWKETFLMLIKENRISKKQMDQIIILLLEREEKRENE